MKKSLLTLSALVAALFATQAVLAQDKTRAEVKKEAAAAVKAGEVEKGPSAAPVGKSTKARAEVKKEAAAAEKAGTIEKGPSPAPVGKSTAERADVKKEAAAAVKAGEVGKGPDVKK